MPSLVEIARISVYFSTETLSYLRKRNAYPSENVRNNSFSLIPSGKERQKNSRTSSMNTMRLSELYVGWVQPWVGLGWIAKLQLFVGCVGQFLACCANWLKS